MKGQLKHSLPGDPRDHIALLRHAVPFPTRTGSRLYVSKCVLCDPVYARISFVSGLLISCCTAVYMNACRTR